MATAAARRLESEGDSMSGFAYDSNHADGTKGGQVVLYCDRSRVALRIPVFDTATLVNIVEHMGQTFGQALPVGTVKLELNVNEETLRVDSGFLERFRVPCQATPSSVVLKFVRFSSSDPFPSKVDLEALLPLNYVYSLSTTAQDALKQGGLAQKTVWQQRDGTHLRHVHSQ